MFPQSSLKEKLSLAFPDASTIEVFDITGTQDHYLVRIIWDGFFGMNSVARHRLVYKNLSDEMRGPIHALTLETRTREEQVKKASGAKITERL
jgi:stress-induced morphogen